MPPPPLMLNIHWNKMSSTHIVIPFYVIDIDIDFMSVLHVEVYV